MQPIESAAFADVGGGAEGQRPDRRRSRAAPHGRGEHHQPGTRASASIAEAGNGVEAVEAFERHHPDVTLLDLRMPEMEGVEAVRQIRARDPLAKVIILTTYDTDEDITRALKAGAKAYILKDISAEALITCIHDVLAGKTYLAPAAAAKLAEGVTRMHLTPRELTALKLMADGKSNKEIANELGISDRTVKTHLGHLFEKLNVTSRTEAIKVASRRGLVRME